MLKVSYYLLLYRVDLLVLILASMLAYWLVARLLARKSNLSLPQRMPFLVAGIILAGTVVAETAAWYQVQSLQRILKGFLPTYAAELQESGHEFITLDTASDDPRYLTLINHEKRWLSANSVVADIYTFRLGPDGVIRLMVDSETDYDRNGRYEGDKELRTQIGEPYPTATPAFFRALAGEVVFEDKVMIDRWGVWVSSFAPIYNREGRVDAAVGVDYPATRWLATIGTVRCISLGLALVLNGILLVSSGLITRLSAEIDQRKAAQRRLEEATESAVSASVSKSEFLALMSHEVRTPLSAILGFANILSETRLDTTQRHYIDTINRAGKGLLDLLDGILDFTHLESGKVKLAQVPWAPALVIYEAMELMSMHARERDLVFTFDNRLPDGLTLNGDPTRVRQILTNLISNAIKCTPQGSVTVEAEWFMNPESQEHGQLVIKVIDTGIGIPADKVPLLFKAFSQVDTSTTRNEGGSGLGLAISHRLAEGMQAELSVTSQEHAGSTFTLRMPARIVVGGGLSTTVIARSMTDPVANWGRALIIDDTRLNRELLKVMLQRLGLEADVAASGEEGLRLAGKKRYRAIFLDLEMPEMDGFATARAIRIAEAGRLSTPIIAVSALTATGTRERCLAAGMDEYITKPVYLPGLTALTERLRLSDFTATAQESDVPVAD